MHRIILRLAVHACLIASAVSLSACDAADAPTATPQLAVSAPAAIGTHVLPAKHQGEDHFDDLAARFPGFAGFYVRGSDLVVMGTDTITAGRAGAAIVQLLASSRVARPIATARVTLRRAAFSYRELAGWRDLALDSLLVRGSGVTLIDVDEAVNRLTLGVAPATFVADSARLSARLLAWGVPSEALRVVPSAADRSLSGSGAAAAMTLPNTLYDSDRPWYAGLQTSTPDGGSCTGGMVADFGSARVLITASHCTLVLRQAWGGSDGSVISDGGPYAAQIATELLDPAAFPCTVGPDAYTNCRRSDIALASITLPSWNARRGAIARPPVMNSCTWGQTPLLACNYQVDQAYPFFTVKGQNSSIYNGMAVEKVGKTTGWTSGTVQATCVYRVSLDVKTGHDYVNTCAHRATAFTEEGDSGGPWFTRSGTDGSVTFIGISSSTSKTEQLGLFTTLASFAADAGIAESAINVTSENVLSGVQLTGGVGPHLTWTAGWLSVWSPYPTEYTVFRKYNAGNGGESLLARATTTSVLEYWDDECVAVESYAGTTPPPANVAWVGYFIAAKNTNATTAQSGTVYYRLSEPPGC